MKRALPLIYLFIASLVSNGNLKANDILIQPRYSSSFKFQTTDVWNVDLQYLKEKPVRVDITALVSKEGTPVFSISAEGLKINPGFQSLSPVSMVTKAISFSNKGFEEVEHLTGSLPAGNYQVCYSIRCTDANCDGAGSDYLSFEGQECFDFVVEPPTPLLLASPEDQSELDWPRPTFNWIPPIPLNQVSGFNYLFTLTERQKGQTCNDAIVRNRPLYSQSGIPLNTEPFPGELNNLDTGKYYCWKVDGLVGNHIVAQSEVWEFRLVKDTIPKELKNYSQSYLNIKDQEALSIYYAIGVLKLKYVLRLGEGNLKFQIKDADGSLIEGGEGDLKIQPGDNRYNIDLLPLDLKNLKEYQILLNSPEGEIYKVKFTYVNPKWYYEKYPKN